MLKLPKRRQELIVSQSIITYKTIICTTHAMKAMKVYIYIYIYIISTYLDATRLENYCDVEKLSVNVHIKGN